MNKKHLILFASALVLAVTLVVGCGNSQPAATESNSEPTPPPAPPVVATVMPTIMTDYMNSGHAKVDLAEGSPALNNACIACHNGVAFEKAAKDMASISNQVSSTTCTTCHGEKGVAAMKAETIELKGLGKVSFGSGNLCASCHNGRGKAPDQKSAPHGSVQANVLLGKNGAGFEGESSVHAEYTNSCVACHTTKDDKGIPNHTFKVTDADVQVACGTCHKGLDKVNKAVSQDYDGNGKPEGIQDEVKGLLKAVKTGVEEKLVADKSEYTQFVSSHGSIYFADKDGKHPEQANAPSEAYYNAAWNYYFVESDGSYGVHNAGFTIKLLQKTYKDITGKDVPNAVILK